MAPGAIAPKLVCASLAMRDRDRCNQCGSEQHYECDQAAPEGEANLVVSLYATADPELRATVEWMLDEAIAGRVKIVGHNISYDLSVLVAFWPDLMPKVWLALERGRIIDTLIREKLLNLATHGRLDFIEVGDVDDEIEALNEALVAAGQDPIDQPDSKAVRITYDLAALAKKYLGEDRSEEKESGIRLRFSTLDGKMARNYPEDAASYAKEDARQTLLVKEAQDCRARREDVPEVFKTETFHVGVSFALRLMSCRGFGVDAEMTAKIEALVAEELKEEKLNLILKRLDPVTKKEIGFLRPSQPPRPYKNGAKNPDGTPKMTAGEPMSVDQKALRDYVVELCRKLDKEVKYTEPSKKFPDGQVCINKEVIGDLAPLDAVMLQTQHYMSLQKIISTELPRLRRAIAAGSPIYYSFDVLKETGRTSSAKFKDEMGIPSTNIQNISSARKVKHRHLAEQDGRKVLIDEGEVLIDVRHAYVAPRPNYLILSVDYSALELVSFAQKTYSLFGESTHRDIINAGVDPHGYLGSVLAYNLDETFRDLCGKQGASDRMAVYKVFASLKKCGDEKWEKFFAHWRKFAKPTGLGFPGGLGPDTFITYAKTTYGVIVDRNMAVTLRELWFEAYPEARPYFNWVNSCVDTRNSTTSRTKYTYASPLGMVRAGCGYCPCANGAALQTPSAEGAKLATFNVVRASYDPGKNELLYGAFEPAAFVHDEVLGFLPNDNLVHERSFEVARIWRESMQLILPDVVVRADPCVMWRWSKEAEPVFDQNKRLIPWEAKK